MARALSAEKRLLIMEKAKELFARNGFAATSVADVAAASDLPVGSIYTYFTNKEDLVREIVDQGWADLRTRLLAELETTIRIEEQLELIVGRFFPELLADSNLITILLSEAVEYTGLEDKVDELVALLERLLGPYVSALPDTALRRSNLETALLVYFLGAMDAMRVANRSRLNISAGDIISFLRMAIRNATGLEL